EGLGWFGRLSMRLAKEYPYQFGFNNLAKSGDRCIDVLSKLRSEALQRTPDIVLIAVGSNDVAREGSPDAPADISEGLRFEVWQQILQTAKKNVDRVFVISLKPVVESRYPAEGAAGRMLWKSNKDIQNYNIVLKKWCDDAGVDFLD